MSGSIDLEDIDYVNWIEKKQVWFEREFSWIFQLRTALAKEDIKIDYPHLLIQSGDIWQFVYPEISPQQIPVLNLNSLLKTASGHGFYEKCLLEKFPVTKSVTDNLKKEAKNRLVGLKAFEGWLSCFEQVLQSPTMLDSDILLCSLYASTYLALTRTLTWCSMNKRRESLRAGKSSYCIGFIPDKDKQNQQTHWQVNRVVTDECQRTL